MTVRRATGAEQVDLQTEVPDETGGTRVVPYTALIYDGQGVSWVYTSPEPLTFLRARSTWSASRGPGLLRGRSRRRRRCRDDGAAEVYGAELEIGGGH